MMIPHVWNITILLGHLSLAAYYFYNEQNSQCLIHISRATKFCEFEFGNEYSNWISLVALSLMVSHLDEQVHCMCGHGLVVMTSASHAGKPSSILGARSIKM